MRGPHHCGPQQCPEHQGRVRILQGHQGHLGSRREAKMPKTWARVLEPELQRGGNSWTIWKANPQHLSSERQRAEGE